MLRAGGWTRALVAVGVAAVCFQAACGGTRSSQGLAGEGGGFGEGGGGAVSLGTPIANLTQREVTKVDLLFVVDNSLSMRDKQELLAEAAAGLVQRLVSPPCVRPCTPADDCSPQLERQGIPIGLNADAEGNCAEGEPAMPAVRDLHVGVISSSLGSHGATGADDACTGTAANDHAYLLGRLRGEPPTWNDSGFLAWDAARVYAPPGDTNPEAFGEKLATSIRSAGEAGCDYEASLEAWYRFLIDPEPPKNVLMEVGTATVSRVGVDDVLLAQRTAFLRPDSAVAIVMLSDENDCSVVDEGYGWLVARAAPQYRSTSACLTNPNARCCQSCAEQTPNDGCGPIDSDPSCAEGTMLGAADDHPSLRCWDQKRRFGFDLLYPTARYVEGLRSPVVGNARGELVPNPLFAPGPGLAPRDRGLVFLAGIVGVPWQDLADEESLVGPDLRYLSSTELLISGRWDLMLGDPTASPPVLPTDPLMLESTHERVGVHPLTFDALARGASDTPNANPINGHEQVNVDDSDLQYACTFPLRAPRTCDEAAREAGVGCDCFAEDLPRNRAVCQPPEGGEAGTEQHYAKAYPGLRQLRVLRDFGDNAVAASICPKVLDPASPAYGYLPAMDALVASLRYVFTPSCFPLELEPALDGSVSCTVIEVRSDLADCDCASDGRRVLEDREVAGAARDLLARNLYCGSPGGVACSDVCLCELPQATGDDLVSCQNDLETDLPAGYCYINAQPGELNVGDRRLVQRCNSDTRRLLRFVGGAPARGGQVLMSCEE